MADKNETSKGKNWSDLPSEIVYLIAKKLPHLLDYIRLHVTCKSWYSSTPLAEFSSNLPWLLEFLEEPYNFISLPTTRLRLYSMFSRETLTIPIKESKWFKGSSNNYLPFIDDGAGSISLFNPLTNDEFVLPLIYNTRKNSLFLMIGTEPGPIRDHRILIVNHGGHMRDFDRWAIYDPHHGRWSKQQGFCILYCYCQGMFFYTCRYEGFETIVIDAFSNTFLYKIPPHEDETTDANLHGENLKYIRYLRSYVVNSSGEILRVNWYHPTDVLTKSKFQFYRLNIEGAGGQPCWDKISNIGDQILFLEVRDDFTMVAYGFLVTAAPAIGLRGGHIYFIDPSTGKPYIYDIGSGIAKMVPCPFKKCTWFVPGLC